MFFFAFFAAYVGLLTNIPLAQAQTYLVNEDFNDETSVLTLHPSTDTLAWKFSKHGGVSGTSCLVSEMVSDSTGGHIKDYYASKSLSLTAGNTYEVTFKCNVQTAGKRKAMLAWSTSGERDGSTLIEDFGSITNTETFTSYSTLFTPSGTGTYYLIYYGLDLDAPSTCVWFTDDFKVEQVNTPPTATLTGPTNNSYYNPEVSVTTTASVTDAESNVTKVEFYSGSTKLGEDATPSSGVYSLTWTPENGGAQSLTAKAIDSYEAIGTSSARTITVRYRPHAELTNPGNSAELLEGPLDLMATATDADGSIVRVVFYADGDSIGVDSTAPYQLNWLAPPSGESGGTALKVRAEDNDGLAGIMEINVKIAPNTCTVETPNGLWIQSLCLGDSLQFVSTASTGAETVRWLRNDGTGWAAVPDATNFRFRAKQTGLYVAEWTYSNGATCTTAVDTVTQIKVSVDTVFTYNGQPELAVAKVSGGIGPYTYSWSTGDCSVDGNGDCDSVMVSYFSGPLVLTVTDLGSCTAVDTVPIQHIALEPPAIHFVSGDAYTMKLDVDGGTCHGYWITVSEPYDYCRLAPVPGTIYEADTVMREPGYIGEGQVVFFQDGLNKTINITNLRPGSTYQISAYGYRKNSLCETVRFTETYGKTWVTTAGGNATDTAAVSHWLTENEELWRTTDSSIQAYIDSNFRVGAESAPADEIVIPVAFHFFGYMDAAGNGLVIPQVNRCRILSQLNALNDHFGNNGTSSTYPIKPKQMGIRFCMAQNPPAGQSWDLLPDGTLMKGVKIHNKHADSLLYNDSYLQFPNQRFLDTIRKFSEYNYLNIWVVNRIGNSHPSGVAAGLGSGNGVQVQMSFFGSEKSGHQNDSCNSTPQFDGLNGNSEWGHTVSHEVGHLFGLMHPFEGGCNGASFDCSKTNDGVCDTPPNEYNNAYTYYGIQGQGYPISTDSIPFAASQEICGYRYCNPAQ